MFRACLNHPAQAANWYCENCHNHLCPSCVSHKRVQHKQAHICTSCSGRCVPLYTVEDQSNFPQKVIRALAYPFTGSGLYVLFGGAIFFSAARVITSFMLLFGIIFSLFLSGYLLTYFLDVIRSTVNDEDEPPLWPENPGIGQNIVTYLFFVLLAVICFAPSYHFFNQDLYLPAILTMLIGLLYLPMATLVIALSRRSAAFYFPLVISGITQTFPAYIFILLVSAPLLIIHGFAINLLSSLGPMTFFVLPLVKLLEVYLYMVIARMLGLLYREYKDVLDWF